MAIRKTNRLILTLSLLFGVFFTAVGISTSTYAANTSDQTVNFTFLWYSPYDYTGARSKENPTSMYMHVNYSDRNAYFHVWAEADANVHSSGRNWQNVSGNHEGNVSPGKTYLFQNSAYESYGYGVPVRFGGYSVENNTYNTNWSPDSVRPSGAYTEY